MNNDTVISVENLSKMYRIGGSLQVTSIRDQFEDFVKHPFGIGKNNFEKDDFWALKNVSFEVKRGDVVGVIGKNGSGKSTLLKILSKIVEPTEGKATMKGRVASLLEVGTGFSGELSGRENIYLNGAILGMSKKEIARKFDEIVDFSGVEKFIDTPVKRYSSGMYVRLAFAVAAHLDSDILLVDEVLAVGDAEFQKKCLGKMKDLAGGGRTVLFVSHDIRAVKQLCKNTILLNQGALIDYDKTRNIIARYLGMSEDLQQHHSLVNSSREGKGDIEFTSFEIVNTNGSKQIESGKEVTFRLNYKNKLLTPGMNCRVSMSISNFSLDPLILLSSEQTNINNFQITTSDGYIDCNIPKFPLSEGKYFVSLFIEANGIVQDYIDNGISLSVSGNQFYKSGKSLPSGWEGKTVLIDHNWLI